MADAWTIVGLILGIIGALLIGQNIWDIIHNRLPKTRLRELEQLLEETGFMLQEGLDDGLLYHPSFLHSIDRRLLSVRFSYEKARTEVYCARSFKDQLKGSYDGLSERISYLSEEAEHIRAILSRTNDIERKRLERESRSIRRSTFEATVYMPIDDTVTLNPMNMSSPIMKDNSSCDSVSLSDLSISAIDIKPIISPFGASVPSLSLPRTALIPRKIVVAHPTDCLVPVLPPPDFGCTEICASPTSYSSVNGSGCAETPSAESFALPQDVVDQGISESEATALVNMLQKLRDNVARLTSAINMQDQIDSGVVALINNATQIVQDHPLVQEVQTLFGRAHPSSPTDDVGAKV